MTSNTTPRRGINHLIKKITSAFRNNYLHDKNYAAIYVHNFFNAFGSSIVSVFSAVLLYKIGFPVWQILLFFAFQFGIMGILSPLSPILVSRVGLARSIVIANIFRIIGIVLLLTSGGSSSHYLFFIFIFFSLHGAIFNPLSDGMNAIYIRDEHKGKVNSFITIISSLALVTAVLTVGRFISSNSMFLLLIVILAMLFSILPYVFLIDKKKITLKCGFFEMYRFLFSENFKENVVPFSVQTFLIIERTMIPLYIFIIAGSFTVFTYVIALSVVLELMVTFLFGIRIDRFLKKSFFKATLLKSTGSFFFLVFNFNVAWLFFNQTYAKIAGNLFDNSFDTLLQDKARKNNPMLFTTAKEMALCFTEFFALSLFALVAYFAGERIFIGIFLASFAAVWVMFTFWKE